MNGAIRVYECEKRERTNGKGEYFLVVGKMAGLTTNFVSEIPLAVGEHKVNVTLSEFNGKMSVKITELAK